MSDEDKWLYISGAIGGAYMAMQSGADPQKCMKAVWEAHQALITGQWPPDRKSDDL